MMIGRNNAAAMADGARSPENVVRHGARWPQQVAAWPPASRLDSIFGAPHHLFADTNVSVTRGAPLRPLARAQGLMDLRPATTNVSVVPAQWKDAIRVGALAVAYVAAARFGLLFHPVS